MATLHSITAFLDLFNMLSTLFEVVKNFLLPKQLFKWGMADANETNLKGIFISRLKVNNFSPKLKPSEKTPISINSAFDRNWKFN
jgi:hypothetical protein